MFLQICNISFHLNEPETEKNEFSKHNAIIMKIWRTIAKHLLIRQQKCTINSNKNSFCTFFRFLSYYHWTSTIHVCFNPVSEAWFGVVTTHAAMTGPRPLQPIGTLVLLQSCLSCGPMDSNIKNWVRTKSQNELATKSIV